MYINELFEGLLLLVHKFDFLKCISIKEDIVIIELYTGLKIIVTAEECRNYYVKIGNLKVYYCSNDISSRERKIINYIITFIRKVVFNKKIITTITDKNIHELLQNDPNLLHESGWRGDNYVDWKINRIGVIEELDSDGNILDIGCANGFFLYFLIQKSHYKHIPFGVDLKRDLINKAKLLHKKYSTHFFCEDAFMFHSKQLFRFIFDSILTYYIYLEKDEKMIIQHINHCLSMREKDGKYFVMIFDDMAEKLSLLKENFFQWGYDVSKEIKSNDMYFLSIDKINK